MPNRLVHETSPYLQQHAHNPVDWYPWGPEALARARQEDKPILLSVGYSACHWCHVMAHESFEDPAVAEFMNAHFINVKVDREERPDLDHLYQLACQILTGQGGWPLNVFLTPDGRPFYAGTYFPPEDRFGRPSWRRVLEAVARTWREDRGRCEKAADQLAAALRQVQTPPEPRPHVPDKPVIARAAGRLAQEFDRQHGGFGTRPKFPHTQQLHLFLRRAADGEDEYLRMALLALRRMAEGGIYDQLGGGFHRYSTDERWLIPHFEKMLYDNALLPQVYLEAYQLTGEAWLARIVRETLDYVARDMTHPDGGFYATEDADSEGEEGKFYVWTGPEVAEVLEGPEAAIVCDYYGIVPGGNFERGTSVLHVAAEPGDLARRYGLTEEELEALLQDARERLFAARQRRVRPGRDEKIITAWNGLMVSALARAAQVLREPRYAQLATAAVRFGETHLRTPDGRLRRSFKEKPAPVPGYLEDYAFWTAGLIDLYEATFDPAYLDRALELADLTLELFWDPERGGFYATPADGEPLLQRVRDPHDGSVPSAEAVATGNLLRLSPLSEGYLERVERVFRLYGQEMERNPWGHATLLGVLDTYLTGLTEVVLAATEQTVGLAPLQEVAWQAFGPRRVLYRFDPSQPQRAPGARRAGGSLPTLFVGKELREGRATAYVCRGFACSPPVVEPAELARRLAEAHQGEGEP